MPFEDEVQVVDLAPWSSNWASEFETLAAQLRAALGGIALAIQHIGSTAVPELLAKDVIDVQVLVHEIRNRGIETAFVRSGFRRRPEPWNQVDLIGGTEFAKTVYAPPPGARPANFGAPLGIQGFRPRLCNSCPTSARRACGHRHRVRGRIAPQLRPRRRVAPAFGR